MIGVDTCEARDVRGVPCCSRLATHGRDYLRRMRELRTTSVQTPGSK